MQCLLQQVHLHHVPHLQAKEEEERLSGGGGQQEERENSSCLGVQVCHGWRGEAGMLP